MGISLLGLFIDEIMLLSQMSVFEEVGFLARSFAREYGDAATDPVLWFGLWYCNLTNATVLHATVVGVIGMARWKEL